MLLNLDKEQQSKLFVKYKKYNRYLTYLLSLILIVFLAGSAVYAEQFKFWDDAISYLGKIYPVNGISNLYSFIIFSSGMIVSSLICFRISIILRGTKDYFIYIIAGIGFILLAVPTDFINIIHTLGGALEVGSFWFYVLKSLIQLLKVRNKMKIFFYHVILHGTVIPYAILYSMGSPLRQGAQKIAVLGLIIILKITVIEYLQFLKKDIDDSTI